MVDGGRGTELVTHHWGARVDGWFASVDETIGTEPDVVPDRSRQGKPAVVLHVHRVLRMLGPHWRTCLSNLRSPYRLLQQVGCLRAVPRDIFDQWTLRQRPQRPLLHVESDPRGLSVPLLKVSQSHIALHASLVHMAARRKGHLPSTVHGSVSGWPALLWAMAVHHYSLQDAH